ncbi:MAG: prepilin-type N-terminal cleavage/methylation domain-containing protein [Candidatus Omnitrophota bacterium]|nr:MAG: prepilin-type N-terminal cleavage/methylation domain-containing protein [Candidatus Omnitrophota bacterium]
MRTRRHTKGMTMPEILVSLAIGAVLIGIVLSMWYFAYRNWTSENIRTRLRVNLEMAMERIKEELRLSSATYISLYDPDGGTNYQAISFPVAEPDKQDSNFFEIEDDKIYWDKSVIYHVYDPGTGQELRRTEFRKNNDVLINETQRDLQLLNVFENGDGSGGPNKSKASTDTIFKNLTELSIIPKAQEFDGYSATAKRSDNVEFGIVRLTPGEHDLKFEVIDQNDSSTGYKLGIDTISIAPSGCQREAEVYTPVASSGDTTSKLGPDVTWSGNYYLQYNADYGDRSGGGDYVTFRLRYDKWLESNFNNSILANTLIAGDDLYVTLPDLDTGNESGWQAEVEAGSVEGDATKADYNDGLGAPKPLTNITVRTLISSGVISGNLNSDTDIFRVKFDSHSLQPLTITSAYIDQRNMATMNQNAVDPAVLGPPGSETRIQLYFTDASNNITPGTTIPAGSSAYSNWAIFPIDTAKDYFITFHITTAAGAYLSYWEGTIAIQPPNDINSYLIGGDYANNSLWPAPTGHDTSVPPALDECVSSKNIYAVAEVEVWLKTGSVTSSIYDTKIASPSYDDIGWDSYEPAGSAITVSAGSSDSEAMSGGTWDSGSSTNPHSLSIGSGRYVQFRADLSLTPFWTCIDHSAITASDADYKSVPPTIACSTCGKYLIPAVNPPWIDNVAIDWPGEANMCGISGYFAQKPDYGIIRLTVDGQELTKGLEFNVTLSETFQEKTCEASLTAEVEPRNTGR